MGLNTRGGKHARPGYLLKARNSRYLPGDTTNRLWALLGRSLFNSTALAANAKAIFPFYIDGGASYICAHAGDSIYEAPLGLTGAFTLAKALGGASSRGVPFSYLNKLFYPSGPSADLGFWTRQTSGWVKGGHRTPTATFIATNQGSGTFASTTDVVYTYRLYDNTTGTESAHGPTVTKTAFNTIVSVRLAFATGVAVNGERGTHLRIYRSLLSEPAGKLYRVDGNGDGIALASVIPGYTFDDSCSNVTALIQGLVQSDGEEATLAWAEYGGPPPQARGGMVFNDHGVLWGVPGRESQVLYTAQGLMECYPVDFDGVYQYYLVFSTSKQDKVMLCRPAGPYMLVLNQNSIFRVLTLPTYQDAGFSRKVQDVLTVDHGCCSYWGADSFGIGTEESSYCIYVSREHGPMLTNGVSDRPIMDQADWLSLVEKSALGQIVVRNYPTMQEAWIFLPGKGSQTCNMALVADYSAMAGRGAGVEYGSTGSLGLRITGPVDVQGDDAFLGWCSDKERFYLVSSSSPYVYVQDSGSADAQANTDSQGDISLEWGLPRIRLGASPFRTGELARVAVEAGAGSKKTFAVEVATQDGVEEYFEDDTVQVGPGETADAAMAASTGNSHRVTLSYLGPTGSTYDESSPDCAPSLRAVSLEVGSLGQQKRMSGS
jgi:hypothetical protein